MGQTYRLLTHVAGERKSVALLDEDRLIEYHQENAASMVGAIMLGRVERVLPDIKAAFVKIGQPQNGFLPLGETDSYHRTMGNASLMSGQDILVQVKKDPKGSKGAFLTRDIALPGQYLLLMPCNRFVGLSKRIANHEERARAKKLGTEIAANRFGVIVRHAALFATYQSVCEEAEALWALWQDIVKRAACAKAPLKLHSEASVSDMILRDYSARHTIETYDDEESWRRYRVDAQLKDALNRRVELPDGGSLVIDEREALQTIDVNSGSVVKANAGESLALEENLRAVSEIARQIRLRNLSGIILVDFIDMDSERERESVLRAMQDATRDDRVKTVIHGFTRLGLLEMTRKRTSDSLKDALCTLCKACHGRGMILDD